VGFLDRIEKNKGKPPRMFIYGGEKLGKSTFVAQCPGIIFLPTESGLDAILEDVPPQLDSLDEIRAAITELIEEEHTFQAVAIDTLTGLERLIHADILSKDRAKTITAACGGYGGGYVRAAEILREILAGLDVLRDKRGMAVFLIGHAVSKTFANPEGPAYDRWQPRGHDAFVNLAIEWADLVGYIGYKERIGTDEQDSKGRVIAKGILGESGTQRVLRLDGGPACRAGSRWLMPREIPLDWNHFAAELSSARKFGTQSGGN